MLHSYETESYKLMQNCPRYNRCNAPECPLDLLLSKRTKRYKGEKKCSLSRNKRLKIGKETNLPNKGLTKGEFAATQRYHSLSVEKEQNKIVYLRQDLIKYQANELKIIV